jgi:hypothetical protein
MRLQNDTRKWNGDTNACGGLIVTAGNWCTDKRAQ